MLQLMNHLRYDDALVNGVSCGQQFSGKSTASHMSLAFAHPIQDVHCFAGPCKVPLIDTAAAQEERPSQAMSGFSFSLKCGVAHTTKMVLSVVLVPSLLCDSLFRVALNTAQ